MNGKAVWAFQPRMKERDYGQLVSRVHSCELCRRLFERNKVLSSANGNLYSKVLFVAEAPGRFGADRTGIPLYGDKTGENFQKLLVHVGWRRDQIFITNAVLCNPRENNGNNGRPTAKEVSNCSVYLNKLIHIVRPDVVVSLGIIALKAISLISPHRIILREGVAKLVPLFNFHIFPLYHPSPRAVIHRSQMQQQSDFMSLANVVHPERGLIGQ